ncbi:hypothetical protein KR009_003745 [Drosophila setifemur]|nr:hypothetical protein KR009_003745 [Drosophila setifemur]
MDYQYFDEESDYIDVDGEGDEDDDELEPANGLDYRFMHQSQGEDEDYYGGAGELEAEEDGIGLPESFLQSLQSCVEPSILQVVQYVAPMLLLCLGCRLLCYLYARKFRLLPSGGAGMGGGGGLAFNDLRSPRLAPLHMIHLACGLTLLHFSLDHRLWLILLLSVVGYLQLQLLHLGRRGAYILAFLTIGSQFLYELLIWRKRSDWPQLRGIQMVVNMKLISIGFDVTGGQLPGGMPSPLSYLGYIFSPATCSLGPWISFGSYLDCLVPRTKWLTSLRRLVPNVLLCLVAVTVSNCISPIASELFNGSSHFLVMYFEALSVRSSHYFVSFIAQALLVASDQRLDRGNRESNLLGPQVTQPGRIEFPRSISSLVRSWNIPMHEWLKRYIYAPCRMGGNSSKWRTIVVVLCTYVVSSLMHGMDLRIYLVLISLALFAEGESLLRRHLSGMLDACISANRCRGKERGCKYTICPTKMSWQSPLYWLVRLGNLAFTALAIFHLAYLGVVLIGDTLDTVGDTESFLEHWKQAGYLSHYIGVGTFVLYLFIS